MLGTGIVNCKQGSTDLKGFTFSYGRKASRKLIMIQWGKDPDTGTDKI